MDNFSSGDFARLGKLLDSAGEGMTSAQMRTVAETNAALSSLILLIA